jgi:hypothetical protein
MKMRTNEAYAVLAYRKSVIQYISAQLRRKFIAAAGSEPQETLTCEDVFPADAQVPQEEIVEYVMELEREEADLDLEMSKFEFARKPDETRQRQRQSSRKKARRQRGKAPEKAN